MKKLISIIGLTSSGKSSLAISLAKMFGGEIVSADSRQVYKGLDYCSGKVTKDEMVQVKHHLIDVCELGKQFTLFDFQKQAYEAIDKIFQSGKQPFLVGGTGLYSRAVVEGYNLAQLGPDESVRSNLENYSLEELASLCKSKNLIVPVEPTKRRLIRLLEKSTGQNQNQPKYDVLQIGIKWSREKIYERIRVRLEARMPNMIDEIQELINSGVDIEFLKSLGLEAKLVAQYLSGEFASYEEFFEELFKQERHFAKRQQTWYNKEQNVVWIDADNLSEEQLLLEAANLIQDFLKK